MKSPDIISDRTFQYIIFLVLSSVVLILAGSLHFFSEAPFQKYFGDINPLWVVLSSSVLGLVLFRFIAFKNGFEIYRHGNYKGLILSAGLSVPFAIVIIIIDSIAPLPVNINVVFPWSLMFYPSIGFVVIILFFLLPFFLLYFILGKLLPGCNMTWPAILLAAAIESGFQVIFMMGENPPWVITYVGLHVYILAMVQLLLLKRYDFTTMYVFRLSYYLLWHVIWGHMRLSILF